MQVAGQLAFSALGRRERAGRNVKTAIPERCADLVFVVSANEAARGSFHKECRVIARSLASKKVSPKGAASRLRMLTFYINRAGKELTESRRKELEKAKRLLSDRIRGQKDGRGR